MPAYQPKYSRRWKLQDPLGTGYAYRELRGKEPVYQLGGPPGSIVEQSVGMKTNIIIVPRKHNDLYNVLKSKPDEILNKCFIEYPEASGENKVFFIKILDAALHLTSSEELEFGDVRYQVLDNFDLFTAVDKQRSKDNVI